MAQMDIDVKLDKSLAELIKTSQKPRKRATSAQSTQKPAQASAQASAARGASDQVRTWSDRRAVSSQILLLSLQCRIIPSRNCVPKA